MKVNGLISLIVLAALAIPFVIFKDAKAQASTCKIGRVTIQKVSSNAPSDVIINVKNSQNVGYFHVSYMDNYSQKGHSSASGYNIDKGHFHSYSRPGTYSPIIYAYNNLDSFKLKKPCDIKSVSLSLERQTQKNGWQWPAEGKIVSVVGKRYQPVTGEYRMHQGIDIKNSIGTRVNAARDGKVAATHAGCRKSASNCGGGYGNYVVLRHSDGLYSIYAHLSQVNTRVGVNVSSGQKIGEMGYTGLTPDVHLHFGIGPTIWVNNNVKDPLKLLPKRS